MQNLRGNQSALWGFENSQWEGGACAPVVPLPWDFFGRVQSRALESKIPPTYLHQKDSTLIKRVHLLRVFYPSLLQNLLPLFDSQTKR